MNVWSLQVHEDDTCEWAVFNKERRIEGEAGTPPEAVQAMREADASLNS